MDDDTGVMHTASKAAQVREDIVPHGANGVYITPKGVKNDYLAAGNPDITPVGARAKFSARVRELVEMDKAEVTEHLASGGRAKEFVDAILWGVNQRPPDRTCLNLRAQIMKNVGEERRITVEFIHSLGAGSEAELRRYVEAARSVEGAGPHDGAERCVAYLAAYFDAFPEHRAPAVQRLGGYVPVEAG